MDVAGCRDESGWNSGCQTRRDQALIAGFLRAVPNNSLELLMFAFNAPAITLNMLNYFPAEDLHTPQLLNWQLDCIPAWTKCHDELQGQGVRPMVTTQ